MTRLLSVQLNVDDEAGEIPELSLIERWAQAAYGAAGDDGAAAEVAISVIGAEAAQQLNLQYRHKNRPTNVLSFPLHAPLESGAVLLGDLAVCAPIVRAEAVEQHKTEQAHWAHMIVHGMLHLQGYDHEDDGQADIMESLEREIMSELGFPDPYRVI